MAIDEQATERALIIRSARENPLDAGSGLTAWDVGVAVFLLGLLFVATFLNLAPARQSIGWALSYTLLGIAPPLVLSLLEHLTRPAGPRKSAKKWVLHFQIILAHFATVIPVSLLATYLASLIVKFLGLNLGLIDLRIGSGKEIPVIIAAFLLNVLIFDFFFYWYHRSLHKSSILWQAHKMHHMDTEFDALTGPRQNWLDSFIEMFFAWIPMAVLFKLDVIDPLDTGLIQGAIIGLLTLFTYQNHSNLRLQFGRFSVVFISSQTHRIHHSYLPQHRDKNFVAFFPIWDILFGTYYHPARDEFPLTGVEGEREIQSVWEVQIFALREWRRMFRAHRRGHSINELQLNGKVD